MPELGALFLSSQAVAAPGELLNLALHAGTVGPEAAVLVAMIATLLVDLAGEKVSVRWVPPICYGGLRYGPGFAGPAVECTPRAFVFRRFSLRSPRDCVPSDCCSFNAFVSPD